MPMLITGGTKGIGLAIAEHLARSPAFTHEALTLGWQSDEAAADAAVARLSGLGARAAAVRGDVGDVGDCARLVEAAAAGGPGPLHIVHSAAMIYPTALMETDLAAFTRAIQANGLSLLYLVRQAQLSAGSSVVFITSAGARTNLANYAALGAGKALAESLIRYLAPELAARGARINAAGPGLVATTSVAKMAGGAEAAERVLERGARANPSGRLTEGADYAAVVEFLLGDGARFVQGQVIHANGGAWVG